MNIVFFGSAQFAVPSFKALIKSGYDISCVVTQPDRKKGRGLHLEETFVKKVSEESGVKVYQPIRINSPEAVKLLRGLAADLFVVIAYGQILSSQILETPKIFCINLHASLLPKYRGAAPINWAIINGEKITGVTTIKMTEKMDAGPIIMQKAVAIDRDDTVLTLEDKLSKPCAELLIESLKNIENGAYNLIAQDESEVSFAPKLKKENGLIDWNKPAEEIYNLIKGLLNWPTAFTFYKDRLLKIYKADLLTAPLPGPRASGQIIKVSKDGIVVCAGKDSLKIEELQIEGKRRMRAEEFICGHKVEAGERLG